VKAAEEGWRDWALMKETAAAVMVAAVTEEPSTVRAATLSTEEPMASSRLARRVQEETLSTALASKAAQALTREKVSIKTLLPVTVVDDLAEEVPPGASTRKVKLGWGETFT